MQPTNSHLPMLKGMVIQPLSELCLQLLKMWFDQFEVVNIVMAV